MVNIKFVENRANITIYRNGQRYKFKQTLNESFVDFQNRIKIGHSDFYNDINWNNETIVKEIKEKEIRAGNPKSFNIELWKIRFPELDFSEFVYEGSNNKSVLKCHIHGKFLNSIRNLSQSKGNGCPECGKNKAQQSIQSIVADPTLWKMNRFLERNLK